MDCHTRLHIIVAAAGRNDGVSLRRELAKTVDTICERVCRMLVRRGLMGEASHGSNEVRLPEEALDGCRAVADRSRQWCDGQGHVEVCAKDAWEA